MSNQLVIFDCDGTLVDSEPLTTRLISIMMGELGIKLSPEQCLEKFAGKNIMAITAYMEQYIGVFDKEAFEKDYRDRSLDIFEMELAPIPGVREVLMNVTVKKCVASNGPHRKMKKTLSVTGLMDFFEPENIFSAYDIQKWKPDPGLFHFALEKMDVSSKNAIVIEDTLPGIWGAIHAGIEVVAYNPFAKNELNIEGVNNFSSMNEIGDYLDRRLASA